MYSLLAELVRPILQSATRKRMFSQPHVLIQPYLVCYQVCFEIGAVLGYTFHHKIELNDAFNMLQGAASMGVGFGGAFPELAEKMYKSEHELQSDTRDYRLLRKAGLHTEGEIPKAVFLADHQRQLNSFVVAFVAKARPDLMPEFESFL